MTALARQDRRGSVLDRALGGDPVLLLLRASLLTVLVNTNDDRLLFVLAAVACVAVLPRPGVLRSPWFWRGCFLVLGVRQLMTWHTLDDHVIATTYWCGALALGLTATAPSRTIAASARLLVGSLFALAAGWKLLSGQFIDGTFFRYTLLFDGRFETVARVAGGTPSAALDANVDDVSAVLADRSSGPVTLREGPRNVAVAHAFTAWGVFIEALVGITFLAPLAKRWGWVRHAALVAFAATTYLVVPIGGFGVLLLVLGSAMVTTERTRRAYYLGAVVLFAWSGIWPAVFL